MGKIKDEIQIQQQLYVQQKSDIRNTCVERSKEYCLLLGLVSEERKIRRDTDLELLHEQQDEKFPVRGYPTMEDLAKSSVINIHGKNEDYHLISKHVCINGWVSVLMAYSTNTEHNMSNGFGTALVNVLTEEAHQELLALLKE